MANQSVENVKNLMKNKSTRVVIFLTFGVVSAAVIFANMTTSNQQARPKELQAAVGAPNMPTVTATPGTSDSPLHNERVREFNKEEAAKAAKTGDSALPRLTSPAGDKEKDPFDLMQKKPDAGKTGDPTVPVPTPVSNIKPNAPAAPLQNAPVAPAQPVQKSQALMQAEGAMSSAMAGLLNSWSPIGQRVEVEFVASNPKKDGAVAAAGSAPAATGAAAAASTDASSAVAKKVAIKAGSILHAVIITSVNSDEPGPVLAQITTGPYAGGRLIGKFELPKDGEKLVLTFTTLTMQNADKSYELSAYAVDPETARTALGSDVDHHYLSRYGMFTAATFLKGYSQALAQQGSTQTISAGANGVTSTTSYPTMSNKDVAITALGSVGSEVAGSLKDGLKRPPTVTLNSGTEVGLLVMKDTSF